MSGTPSNTNCHLGKGEVVGSIPPNSTTKPHKTRAFESPPSGYRAVARRTAQERAAVYVTLASHPVRHPFPWAAP
jgi:hypothetical protein